MNANSSRFSGAAVKIDKLWQNASVSWYNFHWTTKSGKKHFRWERPLVIWPLTTHPFRCGAPFLLLNETPPTFGRSSRFFQIFHRTFCLSYPLSVSPSVAIIYLPPRIAIVFSLLYLCQTFRMPHSSMFLFPFPQSVHLFHIRPLRTYVRTWVLYSVALPQGDIIYW